MRPIRFKVVKSRSARDLPSLRLLNKNGQEVLFHLQEELKKAGAVIGDIVELKTVVPQGKICASIGGDRVGHRCNKCCPEDEL